jgi:hypothetical protein
MTILNANVNANAQSSNSNSGPSLGIVGIASGAAVVGVLGVAFAVAYSRRSPKQKLTQPVYHDEAIEVKQNPVRVGGLDRQRSMSFPPEPEVVLVPRQPAMKNPFATKSINLKFAPTQIRTNYDLPPPPPPPFPPTEDHV